MDFRVVEVKRSPTRRRGDPEAPDLVHGADRRLAVALMVSLAASLTAITVGLLLGDGRGLATLGTLLFTGSIVPALLLWRRHGRSGLHVLVATIIAITALDLLYLDMPVAGDSGLALPMAVAVVAFVLLPLRHAVVHGLAAFALQVYVVLDVGAPVAEWTLLTGAVIFLIAGVAWQRERQHQRMREVSFELATSVHDVRAVLEEVPAAVAKVGRHGRVELVNQAFRDGWLKAVGVPFDDEALLIAQLPAPWAPMVRKHAEAAAQGQSIEVLGRATHAGAEWIVDLTLAGLGDGAYLVAARVLPSQEMLEVKHREDLMKARRRLVNVAAHELKTPLTPLRVQLDLLEAASGELSVGQRRHFESLRRNVDRLAEHVERLTVANELAVGLVRGRFKELDVPSFVADLGRAGIVLVGVDKAPEDRTVRVDPMLLERGLAVIHGAKVGGDAWPTMVVKAEGLAIRIMVVREVPDACFDEDVPFHEESDGNENAAPTLAIHVARGLFQESGATVDFDKERRRIIIRYPFADAPSSLAPGIPRTLGGDSLKDPDLAAADAPPERSVLGHRTT